MEILETTDNGEKICQIAPIGSFNGSDAKGNPIPEHLTVESLTALADKLNSEGEVLVDVDHQSCKAGVERNSRAAGWFSKFFVDPIRGLFGKLKFTRHGAGLVRDREYRFLSPTFALDGEGRPVDLHSVSLTNCPAFQDSIDPIINSAPENKEIIKMEITKDELVQLIKDVVESMNSAPVEEAVEETVVQNSEPVPEEKEEEKEEEVEVKEECENACSKEDEDEKKVENEEPETEVVEETCEAVEEKKDEEEEKKEEVIKFEALNSAPTPGLGDDVKGSTAWKNLHGKEFFDWVNKHRNEI